MQQYATICNPAFQRPNNKLGENRDAVVAVINDNDLLENRKNTFGTNSTSAEALAEVC